MSDDLPDAPPVEQSVLDGVADYADHVVTRLERDQAEAARHGHPSDSLHDQIRGWRFVADVMREWNG